MLAFLGAITLPTTHAYHNLVQNTRITCPFPAATRKPVDCRWVSFVE